MNYKKYVVSFIFCALILFSFVTSWFIPLRSSADVDWSYYGINEGMPYNWSTEFSGYSNYSSFNVETKLQKSAQNTDTDFIILTFVYAPDGVVKSVGIYTLEYYDIDYYINGKNLVVVSKKGMCSNARFNVLGHSMSSCSNAPTSFANVSFNVLLYYDGYTIYVTDHFIKNETVDKPGIFELTKDLLSNLWDDATIFGSNYDLTGILPYDLWSGKWADTIDNVGSDFIDYFKGVLGIDDKVSSSDVEQILYDIDTNNYDTNNYLVNVDSSKRTQLTNMWNNYKRFINNSTTYDTINNVYKPNTSYLNSVYNNQNYFQTYIQSGGSFDTSDIVAILNVISGQLNGVILTALTDINTNISALGGIFANAINTAFTDFGLDLKNLIGKININLKNINDNVTIGNSISNDISNSISTDNDSTLMGKLYLTIKNLGDNITTALDDINLNIKNITNNNPTIGDSNNDDAEDNEFWKEVKARLVTKIPLYFDCVEVLKPITGISSNDLLIGDLYLTDNSSQVALQSAIDTEPTTYSCFDLLNIVSTGQSKKIVFLIPDVNFFGYTFSDFDLDISYYYYNYRQRLSDVILTVVYLSFAFTVCHRVAVVYGGSRTDNDKNGGGT